LIGYGRLTDNAFMRRPWLTLAVLLLLVLVAQSCWACPTCKDNLAADPASANLARGFYYSILFMLSMPYLILTGIGLYFYSLVRKARLEREAAAQQAALSSVAADACEQVAEDCPGPATVVEEEDDELVGV
jgi:hypothetical protein